MHATGSLAARLFEALEAPGGVNAWCLSSILWSLVKLEAAQSKQQVADVVQDLAVVLGPLILQNLQDFTSQVCGRPRYVAWVLLKACSVLCCDDFVCYSSTLQSVQGDSQHQSSMHEVLGPCCMQGLCNVLWGCVQIPGISASATLAVLNQINRALEGPDAHAMDPHVGGLPAHR